MMQGGTPSRVGSSTKIDRPSVQIRRALAGAAVGANVAGMG